MAVTTIRVSATTRLKIQAEVKLRTFSLAFGLCPGFGLSLGRSTTCVLPLALRGRAFAADRRHGRRAAGRRRRCLGDGDAFDGPVMDVWAILAARAGARDPATAVGRIDWCGEVAPLLVIELPAVGHLSLFLNVAIQDADES